MILSIGEDIYHDKIDIKNIKVADIPKEYDIESYEYIIINGGDGMIRRVLRQLHLLSKPPKFILNPIGSFNVVAKIHRVKPLNIVLDKIANGEKLSTEKHHIFRLNDELFLFSAGNMGDAQHIFVSETLRFGWLRNGIGKYVVATIFLLPIHLLLTPFMLMSRERFFIFTPFGFIKKFGSFYGKVEDIDIQMGGGYNIIELDGDLVTIESSHIEIRQAGDVEIVVG